MQRPQLPAALRIAAAFAFACTPTQLVSNGAYGQDDFQPPTRRQETAQRDGTFLPPSRSESETASRSIPPLRTTATITHTPASAPSANPEFLRLSSQTWQQFEQRLARFWGRWMEVRTSEDERYSRLRLPATDASQSMQMLVDRRENAVHFEGSPELADNWRHLVEQMERAARDPAGPRPIPVQGERISTVIQAAREMGFQETAPQEDVTRAFPLNQDQGGLDPTLLQQMGIKGPIQIQVDRELGIIFVTGDEEDVAQAERMIDMIRQSAQSSLPVVDRIPLRNQTGSSAAPIVQQVYDNNFQSIQGPASITALPQDDGLLVIGAPKAIESIKMIASQLDTESEIPVGVGEFKTYRLRYMSAIDAKERIDAYFGQSTQETRTETQPSALPVVTIADFRSNSLIVKASPVYLAQVDKILADLDVAETPDGTKDIVRVFPLRNAVANELALVIQSAINGQLPNSPVADTPVASGGQGVGGAGQQGGGQAGLNNQVTRSPDTSNIRSAMLDLQTIGQNGEVINGGIMFDVRVVADTNSNSLIVTASETSMPLIAELIGQLDRIPNAETQIKVFQIVNGDAQLLFQLLQNLFGGGTQGAQGGGGQLGNQAGSLNQLPLQTASAADGASLVNLRFSVDIRTNSIIASGPVGDLEVVNELLIRLDEDDTQNHRVDVYRLSNAPVLDVAETINNLLAERETQIEFFLGDIQRYNRRVIVVPEVVSNSLLISAVPELYPQIEEIIRKLDRRPPMVRVDVMIAEVNLDALQEFGMEWGLQDSLWYNRGTASDPPINFNFNSSRLGNNDVNRDDFPGQLLSNLGVGRVSSATNIGGLVLQAASESVNVLIRALETKDCVQVLAKPHVTTLENLQARVQVGSDVPFQGQISQNATGNLQSTEFIPTGIILALTPRVSQDGMVVMFVDITNSQLGDSNAGFPIIVDGEQIFQPQIDTTSAQTSVMARDGQTVVFSGLIQETKIKGERGTPILKDIPGIGPLFRFEFDTSERRELLIFLTPHIIDSERTLDQLNRAELDRMHWCLSDVAEIYGDTGYDGLQIAGEQTEVIYPDLDPGARRPLKMNDAAPSVNRTAQGWPNANQGGAPSPQSNDSQRR